ncbi:MAG: hypothetical protein M1832_000194 [Thelocarpon impressellum]|nr:MAG: hypothetical protein M1832_000194 [Thelocarpon impressellum]
MVTMLFGDRNVAYERALKTHHVHGRYHGYENYVLRAEMLDGIWNKPSYMLFLLMKEMKRHPKDRLEWLFWYDADTVIINPSVPLAFFLPPADFEDVRLLFAQDWNGLNAGVFFIRVGWWAIEVMSAILAYRYLRPEEELIFLEQSALARVLDEDCFRHNALEYPQRWFNAYDSGFLNETTRPYQVRRGDMLVHFAGQGDKAERAIFWAGLAEQHLPEWELDLIHTSLPGEFEDFWATRREKLEHESNLVTEARFHAQELISATLDKLDRFQDTLNATESATVQDRIRLLRSACDEEHPTTDKIASAAESLGEATKIFDPLAADSRKGIVKQAHRAILDAEDAMGSLLGGDAWSTSALADLNEQAETLRELLMTVPHDDVAIEAASQGLQRAVEDVARLVEEGRTQQPYVVAM